MRRNSYERSTPMGAILALLMLAMIAGIAGGIYWLGSSDTPPPMSPVEKVIPNDRFKG